MRCSNTMKGRKVKREKEGEGIHISDSSRQGWSTLTADQQPNDSLVASDL